MRTKIMLLIGVGLIVFLMFMGSTAQVQNSRTVWEYKLLDVWTEERTSGLGAEGWELVAVEPIPGGVKAFFKRAKH